MIKEISDRNPETISEIALENYLKFFPAGGSYQSLEHFKQIMDSGEFKKFDHGREENINRYGKRYPQFYDLDNIKGFNINLVCGSEDLLVTPLDYNRIRE